MSLAVVEVQVQRARRMQDAADLLEARSQEPQIVVEVIFVRRLGEQLRGVAAAAETGAVAVVGRGGDERATRLRLARVERRVGVHQLRRLVRKVSQVSEV